MRNWKTSLAALPLLLGLSFGATQAYAAACSAIQIDDNNAAFDSLVAGSPGDLTTAGMTFRATESDGCSGLYDGNNSTAEVQQVADEAGWGTGFLEGPKTDGGGDESATVFGIDFTVSYLGDGTWELDYSGAGLPQTLDVVAVLKQGNFWATYVFFDETFGAAGSSSGTFLIQWCVGGGKDPDPFDCDDTTALSHLSLYFGDPREPPEEAAEPGSLLLLGLGLAGLALVQRRRRRIIG